MDEIFLSAKPVKSSYSLGFIAASFSLATVFAASATPIPLYETYRHTIGLSANDLALTSVIYFAGAVTSLLLLGRLSDFWGRRSSHS